MAPSPRIGSKPVRHSTHNPASRSPIVASSSRAPGVHLSESIAELSATSTSVLICAWLPHGQGALVPEIWQYMLPPDEECRCLNVRTEVWDLDLDLQSFVVVGHQVFLMGYSGDDHEHAVWDVCVEVLFNDSKTW
jgi:hypothetical protein